MGPYVPVLVVVELSTVVVSSTVALTLDRDSSSLQSILSMLHPVHPYGMDKGQSAQE